MNIKSLTILGFSLILFSCEKEIEFKHSEIEEQYVLNSELVVGDVVNAQVVLSSPANKNYSGIKYIANATVEVYQNGNFIEILNFNDKGYYVGTHVVSENNEYTFNVRAGNNNLITGKAITPISVPILNIKQEPIKTEFDESKVSLDISFIDNANVENSYRVAILNKRSGNLSYDYPQSNDPAIETDWVMDEYLYFTDKLFNGEEYSFKIQLSTYADYEYVVYLEHLTEEYYSYQKACALQNQIVGLEMFFQAVQVPCNINGGFGFVGAVNRSTMDITIENK